MQVQAQWKTLVAILISTIGMLHGFAQPSWAMTYAYDEMNRLTGAYYDSTNWIEYKYDKIGNLTDKIAHGTVTTITPTANSGGTITPSGTVTYFIGSSGNFTIRPADGYVIGNVIVDGVAQGAKLYDSYSEPDFEFYSVPFASVTNSLVVTFAADQNSLVAILSG